MGLILDGTSEIGVHVRGEIGNFICSRHLFRSTVVANLDLIFFIRVTFSRAQQFLSYFGSKREKKIVRHIQSNPCWRKFHWFV